MHHGNYYASFDGTDDYAQVSTLPNTIDWSDGFSIEFDATWNSFNNWSRILDFGNGSSSDNILVANYSTSSNLILMMLNGASQETYPFQVNSLVAGEKAKYKLEYLKNGSGTYNVNIYKNGTQIFTTTTSYTVNNIARTINYLGKSNWSDAYFNGRIYDLKISQADGTVILNYDFSNFKRSGQSKTLCVIGNGYTGTVGDISGQNNNMSLFSGLACNKDASRKLLFIF